MHGTFRFNSTQLLKSIFPLSSSASFDAVLELGLVTAEGEGDAPTFVSRPGPMLCSSSPSLDSALGLEFPPEKSDGDKVPIGVTPSSEETGAVIAGGGPSVAKFSTISEAFITTRFNRTKFRILTGFTFLNDQIVEAYGNAIVFVWRPIRTKQIKCACRLSACASSFYVMGRRRSCGLRGCRRQSYSKLARSIRHFCEVKPQAGKAGLRTAPLSIIKYSTTTGTPNMKSINT